MTRKMENEYIPKPVNDCYHVYSDGTRLSILCDEDRDYVVLMNLIPIVAYYCNLSVLALEVMSTHFHAVIRGASKGVEKFRTEVKRLIVRHFNKDGLGDRVARSIDIEVDAIKDEEELRRKIIYVFRNCTEAGYEFLPEDYPWGPGRYGGRRCPPFPRAKSRTQFAPRSQQSRAVFHVPARE